MAPSWWAMSVIELLGREVCHSSQKVNWVCSELPSMKLIITGCDYTGKTTLAKKVIAWVSESLGPRYANDSPVAIHDHFTFPSTELPEDEREKLRALGPKAREQYQRYMITYHLNPAFWKEDYDLVLVGFHIEEAIYAPLYYGYSAPGMYAARSAEARDVEKAIMENDPQAVMVLLKAETEVVRQRMSQHPNPSSPVREEHIEMLLKRFHEEFDNTLIRRRFIIDTSKLTVEDAFQAWLKGIEPYFTAIDILRLLQHRTKAALASSGARSGSD